MKVICSVLAMTILPIRLAKWRHSRLSEKGRAQAAALILLLGLLLVSPARAQMTPPLPNALFGPPVVILTVHPIIDNAARTLWVYVNDAWRAIAYPDALLALESDSAYEALPMIQRADSLYLALETRADAPGRQVWLADPARAQLEAINAPCNTETFSFSYPWVYLDAEGQAVLCNWTTGALSPPLPDDFDWRLAMMNGLPTVSPDGRFVVLHSPIPGEAGQTIERFYSYEVESEQFRLMGEITDRVDLIGVEGWLTPTIFLVMSENMPEWSMRQRYVGHADEADSLHFALRARRIPPRQAENPPELRAMPSVLKDGSTPGPCLLHIYDATTRQVSTHDTGALCEYGLPIPDGSGDELYRALYPAAEVVRYNVRAGIGRTLFRGEVERLGEISPGGGYALIVLGHNGVVDRPHDMSEWDDPNYPTEALDLHEVVIDLETGALLGRLPAEARWVGEGVLFDDAQRYRVEAGGLSVKPLPGAVLLAEGGRALLVTPERSLIVYDPFSDLTVPVGRLPDGYSMSGEMIGDGLARLTLFGTDVPKMRFDLRWP
jgi:hypothetical protein